MSSLAAAKILLVEDERDLSSILVTWLGKHAAFIDTAFDGLEALHKLDSSSYDMVILDLMLPFVDGFEICRRVRSKGLTMPIVVVTARASEAAEKAALESGANLFVRKPFKLTDLVSKMSDVLAQQATIHSTH